jgi:GDP-D-mannose dehydratase
MIGKILINEYETYEAYTSDPSDFLREQARRAQEYVTKKEMERLNRSNWHSFWFCVACICGAILMALI